MTAKNPQRRQELLRVAQGLFFQKGYDNTSIADIHNAAGVSKGAFYHHFASKKDILAAIIDDGIAAAVKSLEQVSRSKTHNAIAKTQSIIALAYKSKVEPPREMVPVGQALQQDSNALLTQKMRTKWLQEAAPILERVVQQGVAESHFNVAHTAEIARVMLVVISDFTDRVQQQLELGEANATPRQAVHTNLQKLLTVLENLLRAEPRSLDLPTIEQQISAAYP